MRTPYQTAKKDQKAQAETKWCYISGLIKAIEGDLISTPQYQSLMTAKTTTELLRAFGDSPYKGIFRQEEDLFNYEKLLHAQLMEKLGWISKYSPQTFIYDYFKVRIDLQELKTKMKSYLAQISSEEMIYEERIEKEIFNQIFPDQTQIPPYYDVAFKNIMKSFMGKKSLQAIDFEADRQMLAIIDKLADGFENEMIKKYTHTFIELKNIGAMWRLKTMNKPLSMLTDLIYLPERSRFTMNELKNLYDLPGSEWPIFLSSYGYQDIFMFGMIGKSSQDSPFPEIEKKADDCLTNIIRQAKYVPFGAEVVFAYIASFFMEILNLKIIITSTLNQLTEGVIRAKVRQVYV